MAEATPPVNRFGPYIVHGKIGSGGMAVVYKAFNEETQKTAALKILRTAMMEQADVVERFKQEAKIAEHLRHSHIVAVNNYGAVKGRYFLELQYMSGGTLAERLAAPVEIGAQEVVRMLRNIASGLDYAHRQGVIHRDLKLENILLDDKRSAFIADFSIARLNDSSKLTATGFVVGTPLTIAPEQARGDAGLDYRADLYSLAIIAYVLAVGRYPFNGSNPLAILHQHLSEPVPPPSLINSALPKGLDAVLIKGLAKQPDERYPNADMFVEAFARVVGESSMSSTIVDLQSDVSGKRIDLPAPKRAESAEGWMQKALATTDQDEAIGYLKRVLEIEPLHSKANRLLFQLEGAVPKNTPVRPKPAPVTQHDLADLKKATAYKRKSNTWSYAVVIGAVLVGVSVLFFYLMLSGSPIATQIANIIQGRQAVTEIDGVPIAEVPNAVMQVVPQERTTLEDGQKANSKLENGFSSAYAFNAVEGQVFDVGVLFLDATAKHVTKNVAIVDASGKNASSRCERSSNLALDTSVSFSCKIDETGQWSVRILGITGESTGSYWVLVDRVA